MLARIITALAFLLVAAAVHAGPVDTLTGEWTDAARTNRVVPYKIYIPRDAKTVMSRSRYSMRAPTHRQCFRAAR
jgi:hypothetical protein